MERLDLNDIDLIRMMSAELDKICDEIKEDLNENPGVRMDLASMFEKPEALATLLVTIYATMEPDVRRRLDNVAEMYRGVCA